MAQERMARRSEAQAPLQDAAVVAVPRMTLGQPQKQRASPLARIQPEVSVQVREPKVQQAVVRRQAEPAWEQAEAQPRAWPQPEPGAQAQDEPARQLLPSFE